MVSETIADPGLQQTSLSDHSIPDIPLLHVNLECGSSSIAILPLLSICHDLVETFLDYLAFKCLVINSDN